MKVADRLTTFFFLATIFSVSFQNVYWNVAGRVNLADILALMFLIAFVAARIRDRDRRVPATTWPPSRRRSTGCTHAGGAARSRAEAFRRR